MTWVDSIAIGDANEWVLALRSARRRPDRGGRQGASHAGAAIKVVNRRKLKAALAKTTNQSTFGSPRSLILRSHAMVFSQPKAGSTRGRAC
jgi:hypothetical protein